MTDSSNGNGSPNGARAGTPASRFRTQLAAKDQAKAEGLSDSLSRAEEVLRTVPPQLTQTLTEAGDKLSTALSGWEQRIGAMVGRVEQAAANYVTKADRAEQWYQAQTAAEERMAKTLTAAAATAAKVASEARSVRWRAWLTGGVGPTFALLVLGLLLWAVDPFRATVAEGLLTRVQRQQLYNGRVLEQVMADPQLPAGQRCAIEAATGWQPHQGLPCPTRETGRGSSGR